MSNDDRSVVSKEGILQVKIHGQPKCHRRHCVIHWDKSVLYVESKTDRQYGDWIKLLPSVQITDSELPSDYTIEIKADNETHALLPESKKEHDCWLIALKRTAYSRFGGGIFGQSLEDTYKYSLDKTSLVPLIVRQCCDFLLEHGTNFVGLFRIPGKQSLIRELRDKYDRGLPLEFEATCSPATVSSLLKVYLQSLPEPIIPMRNFEHFLELGSRFKYNQTNDLEALKRLIRTSLSNINYALLAYLCVFLKKLTEYAQETKMDTENLAITFGSNLIRASEELDINMIKGHNYNLFPLIRALIDQSDFLFTPGLTESCEQFNESCEHQHETITKSSGFSSFSSLLSSNEHPIVVRTRSSSLPSIPYATSSLNDRVEFHPAVRAAKDDLQYRSKSLIEKVISEVTPRLKHTQGEYTVNEEKDETDVERRLTTSDRVEREDPTEEQSCSKKQKHKSAIPWQFFSKASSPATLPRKTSQKSLAEKFAKPFSNIKLRNTLDSSFRLSNRTDARRSIDVRSSADCLKMLENEVAQLKSLLEEKDSTIKTLQNERGRYEKENFDLRQQIEQLQYENSQLKAI